MMPGRAIGGKKASRGGGGEMKHGRKFVCMPLIDEEFCKQHNVKSVSEIFPRKTWALMHTQLFKHGITHVENLGGEIDQVLNRRVIIGCFPLKLVAESAPCRAVAWLKR